MQWYDGYWFDGYWKHALTRAKNEKAARAKIEASIGCPVEGISKVTGYMLKHFKGNKQHYTWVD